MSSSAQFRFAAEFVTFLAAASGLALVLLRAELLSRVSWARFAFGAGVTAIGAAAFLHGSLIIESATNPVLLLIGGAGIASMGAATTQWHGERSTRTVLWVSLAFLVVAMAGEALSQSGVAAVATLLGGVGLGVATLAASRRAIAARIAASAAGALLLVVLVLSLALSQVISSRVQADAQRRLQTRAAQEASQLQDRGPRTAVEEASTAAFAIGQTALASDALHRTPDYQSLLEKLSQLYQGRAFAFLNGTGNPVASVKVDQALLITLQRSPLVQNLRCPSQGQGGIQVVGTGAFAIGAQPLCFPDANNQTTFVGSVLAVVPLDGGYLTFQGIDDANLHFALLSRSAVVAAVGSQPDGVRGLADKVLADGSPTAGTLAASYVSVQPVKVSDRAVLALVASTPTKDFEGTRRKLFQTLFLIALGGTLLALLLSAVVGERVGSRLRRLTLAAEGIQRGELTTRTGIESEDEVGVLGTAFDSMALSIEEKTSALEQAAADESRLRNRLEAVVAGMGEALVAVDDEGRVTDFNQAAEELIGIAASAARGRSVDYVVKLVSDDGADLGRRLVKPSVRRWAALGSITATDGKIVPVAMSAGALRDPNGDVVGAVYVFRDLRGEREVERMKTEFLSHMGHELRTPLAVVIGFSELMTRRDMAADEMRDRAHDILGSARRLQRIVELLEFVASSSAGRVPLRPEELDLRQVVDKTVDRWSRRVGKKHEITRRVARGVPKVSADARWLSASLDELVDNAVKFSPKGGKVAVTVEPSLNGTGRGVRISVSDRGKGMTADEQSLAFSEFVQGDGSDTRSYGGLGLGLAMVHRIAEAHGGTVACDSSPGRGSTFSIFLPTTKRKRS
ncbi:MAG: two-component system, OmpR family, sensor histidine kinase VicK [Actinomycetota bacterium]|jgi:PAS domain S-box-containing protein|nr:two-component system, OmpR family, sensor histidine kinase VicK [Actinomycetota bacterium]